MIFINVVSNVDNANLVREDLVWRDVGANVTEVLILITEGDSVRFNLVKTVIRTLFNLESLGELVRFNDAVSIENEVSDLIPRAFVDDVADGDPGVVFADPAEPSTFFVFAVNVSLRQRRVVHE